MGNLFAVRLYYPLNQSKGLQKTQSAFLGGALKNLSQK